MCGENDLGFTLYPPRYGSPPRVRGKRCRRSIFCQDCRITPACAGKTLSPALRVSAPTDHPRVCGENGTRASKKRAPCGSPPRMRGKRENTCPPSARGRITPAHAGKTTSVPLNNPLWTDHPRACGENASIVLYFATLVGSPPRMRGKRHPQGQEWPLSRITPACAGKTVPVVIEKHAPEDHPRVCGENCLGARKSNPANGSPPRVRGKLAVRIARLFVVRITPACAGKTGGSSP